MNLHNFLDDHDPENIFATDSDGIAHLDGSLPRATLNRRRFLVLTGLSGLAIGITSLSPSVRAQSPGSMKPEDLGINQYVQIDTSGSIILFAPNPDTGQGVRTSLPMILAEELDADWSQVVVKSANVDKELYGLQYAGGSDSIPRRWPELRKMGAMARQMLIEAAAEQLQVPKKELTTAKSQVIHKKSRRKLNYADLAPSAAKLRPPADDTITYKDPKKYKILGKRITGVDNEAIAVGSPIFGIDVRVPGMLYATFAKCPVMGARVKSANLLHIKTLPGVVDAFLLKGTNDIPKYNAFNSSVSSGVAIVAKTTWQAFKARKSLEVDWDLSAALKDDSVEIRQQAETLAKQVDTKTAKVIVEQGDVDAVFNSSDRVVEGFYSTDFISHAQLEPNGCVVHHKGDSVEAWVSSQTPTATVVAMAKALDLAPDKVTVRQIRGGGGFGRRLTNEYACEAGLISKKVQAPVKLQWMREDDMAFDYYRPPGYNAFKASLTTEGKVDAWSHHVISVSADGKEPNRDAGPGYGRRFIAQQSVPNYRVTNAMVASEAPTGPMRAPGSNTYAFAEQSFIHELAVKAQRDHVELLLEMLGKPEWTTPGELRAIHTGRAADVIKRVARNARWGKRMPKGRALGLSFYFSHAAHIAEIADVSVSQKNRVKVHKVWVVADIGPIINLSGAEGQAQGSVIDGLSTMARQSISIKEGQVEQTNYHQYPLLRIGQRPEVDVQFLQTDNIPTGIGEPALPPVAAAVCNAVYSVTGKRIRSMPISNEGFYI